MDDEEVGRMWDRNAPMWARGVRAGYDTYRDLFNNPAFFEFAGDLSGLTVLDVGCGEGYNTRLWAQQGANMTGADISAEMIRLARQAEKAEPLGIRYEVAAAADMPMFADCSFDAVVSTMTLMDCADYEAAVREIARVLKPGGLLAFSITHPFSCNAHVGHLYDDEGRPIGIQVGDYFGAKPGVDVWRFGRAPKDRPREPFHTPRFPRTLEEYLNPLPTKALVIERIHEPRPSEEACRQDPRLYQWRVAPIFLYVRARRASRLG